MKVDICGYDSPDDVGGPIVWLQRLPIRLLELGFDVRVLLFSWQEPAFGRAYRVLKEQGIPVQSTVFRDTQSNVLWLLKAAEERQPDVFVANHVIPALYAARYLKKSGVATIGILRSHDRFYHAIVERFVKPTGPWQLGWLVCVSEHLRQLAVMRGASPRSTFRIPSGAPIPNRKAAAPSDILKIAYVGRIVEEQKQISAVTRTLIRATDEVEGVEAALYGDGAAASAVAGIIAQSGSPNVRLFGGISSDEVQTRLLESHVIVLLSDYEGTPMAVMEAMACGCVPVCLEIESGLSELVEHEVTGLVVTDRGSSFVAAIKRLREDCALWEHLSNNARSRIVEGYSIAKSASDWADLLRTAGIDASKKKTFISPRRIRLPVTLEGFAHQDRRRLSVLSRVLSAIQFRHKRLRMLIGRIRRRLMGQTVT